MAHSKGRKEEAHISLRFIYANINPSTMASLDGVMKKDLVGVEGDPNPLKEERPEPCAPT